MGFDEEDLTLSQVLIDPKSIRYLNLVFFRLPDYWFRSFLLLTLFILEPGNRSTIIIKNNTNLKIVFKNRFLLFYSFIILILVVGFFPLKIV